MKQKSRRKKFTTMQGSKKKPGSGGRFAALKERLAARSKGRKGA